MSVTQRVMWVRLRQLRLVRGMELKIYSVFHHCLPTVVKFYKTVLFSVYVCVHVCVC